MINMAVWVATDLHGNYDLWAQIKAFLKEDDTLIYLGDAVDRGSRGFEIFMELLNDERVCYLRGNHEEMMADAYIIPEDPKILKHWLRNGGGATKDNIDSLGLEWEQKKELMRKVYQLPCYAEYTSDVNGLKFILCHAGYTPGDFYNNMDRWRKEQYLLWSRDHWRLPWPQDPEYDNVVIVHGHTPILLMKEYGATNADGCSPYWYQENHKLNLDAATANTGIAFLFNLDTLDWEYFLADPDFKA